MRWQEYTEELYKKDLPDPDNHDGVITDLEPDILECEIKWALGSITMNKANGGDSIPVELLQILKDDAVKELHSICQHLENSAVATGLEKVKAFDCVDHHKLWKILQEMGMSDHLTCLLRNLYAGQEATVRTGHRTGD